MLLSMGSCLEVYLHVDIVIDIQLWVDIAVLAAFLRQDKLVA